MPLYQSIHFYRFAEKYYCPTKNINFVLDCFVAGLSYYLFSVRYIPVSLWTLSGNSWPTPEWHGLQSQVGRPASFRSTWAPCCASQVPLRGACVHHPLYLASAENNITRQWWIIKNKKINRRADQLNNNYITTNLQATTFGTWRVQFRGA